MKELRVRVAVHSAAIVLSDQEILLAPECFPGPCLAGRAVLSRWSMGRQGYSFRRTFLSTHDSHVSKGLVNVRRSFPHPTRTVEFENYSRMHSSAPRLFH